MRENESEAVSEGCKFSRNNKKHNKKIQEAKRISSKINRYTQTSHNDISDSNDKKKNFQVARKHKT